MDLTFVSTIWPELYQSPLCDNPESSPCPPNIPPAALTAPHGRRRRTPSGSSPGPSCGSPISRMAAPFPRPSTSFQHQSPSTTSSGQFHHSYQHISTACDRWGYLRMCGGSSKMKKEHLKTVRVSMPRYRALCRPVCAACLLLVYSYINMSCPVIVSTKHKQYSAWSRFKQYVNW